MLEFMKGLIFFFINNMLNHIPSRKVRAFFYYYLSGKKISKNCSIGLGVRFLDIRNVSIGSGTNINFDCIIDGRGASIKIGSNVDIAPQVNIWSLEHNAKKSNHETLAGTVIIEDGCWLANRVIVLPKTHLKRNTVVGAGGVVKGNYPESVLLIGQKVKIHSNTFLEERELLKEIRAFR